MIYGPGYLLLPWEVKLWISQISLDVITNTQWGKNKESSMGGVLEVCCQREHWVALGGVSGCSTETSAINEPYLCPDTVVFPSPLPAFSIAATLYIAACMTPTSHCAWSAQRTYCVSRKSWNRCWWLLFLFYPLSFLLLTVFYHAVNCISVGAHCCDSVLRLHRQGKSNSSFFFPLQQMYMPLFPINKSWSTWLGMHIMLLSSLRHSSQKELSQNA